MPERPVTPLPSLRERKKAAAMHRIQMVALRMVDERGFDGVTVEEVAAEAEVSPSTVYRYFGTKEGMVLTDAFDEQAFVGMDHLIRQGVQPWDAVLTAVSDVARVNSAELDELAALRARLWFEVSAVKAAAYLAMDRGAEYLAHALVDGAGYERNDARVVANAILWALVAAIENWYEAGAQGDWLPFVHDGLAALRRTGLPPEPAVERVAEGD